MSHAAAAAHAAAASAVKPAAQALALSLLLILPPLELLTQPAVRHHVPLCCAEPHQGPAGVVGAG